MIARSIGTLVALLVCCHFSIAAPADLTQLDNNIPTDEDGFNSEPLSGFPEEIVDVNQTIEQVEAILLANPLLPRLSKQDILNLLSNITAEDKLKMQANESEVKTETPESKVSETEKTREEGGKSIMVVMPYQPDSLDEKDIAELYTKPPIIKFVTSKYPVYTGNDDTTTNSPQYQNHKYGEEDEFQTDNSSGSRVTDSPLNADFWHNQAQKVMDDLKKQNHKSTLKSSVYKENKDAELSQVPFKKMPPGFQTSDTSVEVIVNGEPVNSSGKFSSQYDAASLVLPPNTNPADEVPMPENLKDLLASVGLFNENQAPNVYPGDKQVEIPIELQGVLNSFGMVMSGNSPMIAESSYLDASPYVEFKPLPTDKSNFNGVLHSDIEDVLETFGILGSKNTPSGSNIPFKIMQDPEKPTKTIDHILNTDFVDPDMFPAGMTSMLTDMGLTKKKGRKISQLSSKNQNVDASKKSPKKNGTLKDTELSLGPDPLSIDELESVDDKITNDIKKRQEPSSSTTTESPTTTTTSTEKPNDNNESASEDPKEGPALADLESSFGGSPADNDPSEAELPPPRKNGFYYMLDWNSFLEVGEGDTKVNIRFDPKLGDPQRFIAVTVP